MSGFGPEEAAIAAIPDEPTPDYLNSLKGLLALVDDAMRKEQISATTRARVVSRVLHGTPTPPDTRDWADAAPPEPEHLAVINALADAAPAPPMNAGASTRRTLAEERAEEDAWLARQW